MLPDLRGFENQLRVLKGRVPTDNHEHQWRTECYEVCEICGLRRKVEERREK